jgi:PAS domain S-box-containing protein
VEKILASASEDTVFRRCVEDCFEPVMLTDRQGTLVYVNPAWSLTYGYSRAEALGQNPRLLRSSRQDGAFYREMWAKILDPEIGYWRGEVVNRAKDGHLVPVLLTITPYRERAGAIIGYMGIAVDLTETKRMETQILRQDRLASVGLLASGLAHEIGNPLGVIRGRAELLMKHVRDNDTAARNLEVIVGQIDRISGLITSLLRVSRVPDQILLREIPLANAVREVAVLVEESCRRSKIALRSRDLDGSIMAEPSSFQQILLNLIINATHAIAEQRAKAPAAAEGVAAGAAAGVAAGTGHFIEISARALPGDEWTEIRLRDSGVGISAENLGKMFQPFFTTKAAGQGTGMGLAIVAKLVEEMRGTVSVESEGVGQGATVILRLRRASR